MGPTKWILYCHTHIATGRRYVGITTKSMEQRWRRHIADAGRNRGLGCAFFWNAIRKYGPQAFSHEVLEVCHDLEVANLAEECWIEFYDTRNPENGFNLAKGGQHTPHPIRKNPWDDPAYRANCSNAIRSRMSDFNIRAECSRTSLEVHSRSDVKAKLSAASTRMWSDPGYRAKQQRRVGSPEFAEKCLSGFRNGAALNREKTHCVHGHPLSGDNLKIRGNSRICLSCKRERTRRWKENLAPDRAERRLERGREYARQRRDGRSPDKLIMGGPR